MEAPGADFQDRSSQSEPCQEVERKAGRRASQGLLTRRGWRKRRFLLTQSCYVSDTQVQIYLGVTRACPIAQNISRNRQADNDAGCPLLTPHSCTSYTPMSFAVQQDLKGTPWSHTQTPRGLFHMQHPQTLEPTQYNQRSIHHIGIHAPRKDRAGRTHTHAPRNERVGHTHTHTHRVYYSQDC